MSHTRKCEIRFITQNIPRKNALVIIATPKTNPAPGRIAIYKVVDKYKFTGRDFLIHTEIELNAVFENIIRKGMKSPNIEKIIVVEEYLLCKFRVIQETGAPITVEKIGEIRSLLEEIILRNLELV